MYKAYIYGDLELKVGEGGSIGLRKKTSKSLGDAMEDEINKASVMIEY